ncbi:super-infection exclusion protein B [Aliarcobacter cryaerophilus]|uniref:super-infection exclusion protein B n=1 Tax=Aliarcobacter cryaerophilus TaxID=28198 RepID=UPI003BAF9036
MIENIEKFFQAIHLAPRHLFGICVLGLFLLFSSSNVLSIFGIETIVNDHRAFIGLLTLFSLVFFIIQLIPAISKKYRLHQYKKQLLNELYSLSKEEKVLLLYCLYNNQKTISLPISHSVANRLKSKGILIMSRGTENILACPYNIHNDIWNKLQKYELILLDNLTEPEIQRITQKIFSNLYT